jgi:hypothetical protein
MPFGIFVIFVVHKTTLRKPCRSTATQKLMRSPPEPRRHERDERLKEVLMPFETFVIFVVHKTTLRKPCGKTAAPQLIEKPPRTTKTRRG